MHRIKTKQNYTLKNDNQIILVLKKLNYNKNCIGSVLIFVLHFMHVCWCFYVFTGEENSRVQAHIDGDEFSAHILTDDTEYNVEVTISTLFYTWQKYVSLFVFPVLF